MFHWSQIKTYQPYDKIGGFCLSEISKRVETIHEQ